MKKFFFGWLRLELLLGVGAVIGAALFMAADGAAAFASAWYWSLDELAQQRAAHFAVALVPLSLALSGLGWWRLRRGQGQASE
jgi:hypothetical protein